MVLYSLACVCIVLCQNPLWLWCAWAAFSFNRFTCTQHCSVRSCMCMENMRLVRVIDCCHVSSQGDCIATHRTCMFLFLFSFFACFSFSIALACESSVHVCTQCISKHDNTITLRLVLFLKISCFYYWTTLLLLVRAQRAMLAHCYCVRVCRCVKIANVIG